MSQELQETLNRMAAAAQVILDEILDKINEDC